MFWGLGDEAKFAGEGIGGVAVDDAFIDVIEEGLDGGLDFGGFGAAVAVAVRGGVAVVLAEKAEGGVDIGCDFADGGIPGFLRVKFFWIPRVIGDAEESNF